MHKRIFLEAAARIASYLCKSSIWNRDLCTWIGRSGEYLFDHNRSKGITRLKSTSLEGDLYGGTSGIGLFLAYMYLYNKAAKYENSAFGAICHSLTKIDKIPNLNNYGFYNGKIGIAYAAFIIGSILKKYELVRKSIDICSALENEYSEGGHLLDIISGNAGAIPALLHIYKQSGAKCLLRLAENRGEELIATATKSKHGWSWNSKANGIETRNNLTGFAHGAAGMGYSLLELFSETHTEHFRYAAEMAYKYENAQFVKAFKNWPDFQTYQGDKAHKDASLLNVNHWCHGAAGIGLTRLRAFQILNDSQYLNDLSYALKSNMNFIRRMMISKSDYSLCHGLSGNAELFIYSGLAFDKSYLDFAYAVGRFGISNYVGKHIPWPCGISEGQTPGLMLGLSGIGYYYLRLYDPGIPSILLIIPYYPQEVINTI